MKILVTGGAGFIGSHLIQALQQANHTVINVDEVNDYYNPEFKRYNLSLLSRYPHYTFYQQDIKDRAALQTIFEKHRPEVVIHLGARAGVRHSLTDPELYRQVNFSGTQGLVETATAFGVKQFVFGSTSAVYGNTTALPFSEEASNLKPLSPYAETKLAAEQFLKAHQASTGLPTTVLRFFTVYGERGRPDMAPYLFTEAILKDLEIKKFGDGTSSRDYTYIADIVAGIVAAVEHPFPFEIINLGNHQAVSLNEFIDALEIITGLKANLVLYPQQAGEMQHTLADIRKAQRLLGYQPTTSLHDGLEKFVRWFKANRL